MKNLLVTLISLFIFTSANAQKFPKPEATDADRQHIETVFGDAINPDKVWRESKIKVLSNVPSENYSTSFPKDGKLEWVKRSPREGDTVMIYDGKYFKKYNSQYNYYLQVKQTQLQAVYAANSPQPNQPTQKAPKAPKEPKGNGGGVLGAIGNGLINIAREKIGQSDSNFGVGKGPLPTVIGDRVY